MLPLLDVTDPVDPDVEEPPDREDVDPELPDEPDDDDPDRTVAEPLLDDPAGAGREPA